MPDLRPHLAAAAAVVVPLRLGGGTRLKIVEAMAMGKAIVSTTLGAEGIEAVPGRDLLIEDQPAAFADAVNRLLAEPELGGAHRPVGKAAGGGAVCLERGGPGARGLLPPNPGERLVKAALIGAGQIARQHLACLKTLPGVELAAICDLSPATAEAAAERYGVRPGSPTTAPCWRRSGPTWSTSPRRRPPTSGWRWTRSTPAPTSSWRSRPPRPSRSWRALARRAQEAGRHFVEDYNYVFNHAPQEILRRIESGEFGAVTHVEVLICLDILGPRRLRRSQLAAPRAHACRRCDRRLPASPGVAGASLRRCRTGRRRRSGPSASPRSCRIDEFRALVDAERGTAALGFSASSQPDAFWLRVYGERMQATANLFETRLTFDGPRNVPKPLRPFFSGLEEGKTIRRAALATLLRKFKGPGAYEGLWELLARTYRALADGSALPVTASDVLEVNRMVEALKPREQRP